MERRKRIRWGSEDVDATVLTFQTAGENWNEYLLNDGTVVKLKAVATEFLRLDGRFDNDGNPVYICRSANVVAVSAPDNLRQQPGGG